MKAQFTEDTNKLLIPEGWRQLASKEIIRAGDHFYCEVDRKWKVTITQIGKAVEWGNYIRKLEREN